MDNILKELIQIEGAADSKITDAREEMDHLDEQKIKKEVEIRRKIEEQSAQQLENLSRAAEQASKEEIARIKRQTEQIIEDLEKLFEQNRSHWEADIVNQIIGQ